MDTEKIKKTIFTGLRAISQRHTEQTLGDRKKYLGASDIGNCPRKIIFERIYEPEHDLATLIRFQRGHMAEDIIANIFSATGFKNFRRQVEVDISTDSTPILVHIDFVFTSEPKKIKSILEVKSGTIPESPYSSWELQLYLQMGALEKEYPDYEIRGAILSLDLSEGDVALFNSYTPSESLFNGLIQRAESIWQDYQQALNGKEIDVKIEAGPLCGFCSAIRNCPLFKNIGDFPDSGMNDYILEFQGFRDKEKQYKNRVANHKSSILRMVNNIGAFQAGGFLFQKVTRTRQNINKISLGNFLADNGTSLSAFEEPSTFSFLDIKKVPKEVDPHTH
jgi:CRISPR-associated exonuclease Cas4